MKHLTFSLIGLVLMFTNPCNAATMTCETRHITGADLVTFNFSGSLLNGENGGVRITSRFGLKASGTYKVIRNPCPSDYCGNYSIIFDSFNGQVLSPSNVKQVDGFFGVTRNEIRQDAINFSYRDRSLRDFAWLVNCR